MTKPFAVEFNQVTHDYGSTIALKNVSYVAPKGSICGLIGPNGSGKSTSLNIMTTALQPTSGEVRIAGFDPVTQSLDIKRRLGYAPEEPLLYQGLTAEEFVVMSGVLHGMAEGEARDRGHMLLNCFGISARRHEVLAGFSKGMKRKVLLSSALVHDPEILVLDEPLDGLDVVAQKVLKDLLREHGSRGKTVIYSTHILEVVAGLCTHLVLLRHGDLLAQGTYAQVTAELGIDTLEQAFVAESGR